MNAPLIRTWEVMPVKHAHPDVVQTYWQTLHMHDTLKYRLCDVNNPTWSDVKDMIIRMGQSMYVIYDSERKEIISEFMLENFTGHSAQVHFSMHPANTTPYSLRVAREATDDILNLWTRDADRKVPYLQSIYGLTPVTNRAACIFVQKVGFRKLGVLPGGMSDRGQIVDAMLTVKARS